MIHLKEFINGNFEHFKHVFHTSYYLNFDYLNLFSYSRQRIKSNMFEFNMMNMFRERRAFPTKLPRNATTGQSQPGRIS